VFRPLKGAAGGKEAKETIGCSRKRVKENLSLPTKRTQFYNKCSKTVKGLFWHEREESDTKQKLIFHFL